MQYRPFGHAGIQISALDEGVTLVDTAEHLGGAENERLARRAIGTRGGRSGGCG